MAQQLSCSAAYGIFQNQGLNLCSLHWQGGSYRLYHQINWFTEMGWKESVRTCYCVRRIPEDHEWDVKPEWARFWKESWGLGEAGGKIERGRWSHNWSWGSSNSFVLDKAWALRSCFTLWPKKGAKKGEGEVIQVQAWFRPSMSKNGWDAKPVGKAA